MKQLKIPATKQSGTLTKLLVVLGCVALLVFIGWAVYRQMGKSGIKAKSKFVGALAAAAAANPVAATVIAGGIVATNPGLAVPLAFCGVLAYICWYMFTDHTPSESQGWKKWHDDKGKTYYQNTQTGKSHWDTCDIPHSPDMNAFKQKLYTAGLGNDKIDYHADNAETCKAWVEGGRRHLPQKVHAEVKDLPARPCQGYGGHCMLKDTTCGVGGADMAKFEKLLNDVDQPQYRMVWKDGKRPEDHANPATCKEFVKLGRIPDKVLADLDRLPSQAYGAAGRGYEIVKEDSQPTRTLRSCVAFDEKNSGLTPVELTCVTII